MGDLFPCPSGGIPGSLLVQCRCVPFKCYTSIEPNYAQASKCARPSCALPCVVLLSICTQPVSLCISSHTQL